MINSLLYELQEARLRRLGLIKSLPKTQHGYKILEPSDGLCFTVYRLWTRALECSLWTIDCGDLNSIQSMGFGKILPLER